jgi:hypothetical protein
VTDHPDDQHVERLVPPGVADKWLAGEITTDDLNQLMFGDRTDHGRHRRPARTLTDRLLRRGTER